jgi:hypothetical protein
MQRVVITDLTCARPRERHTQRPNALSLDVWKGRQTDAKRARANLQAAVTQKSERLDRIDDAFLHERSIDRHTYERQRDQAREQLALAEMELSAAAESQFDIDGVLAFAEHLLTNATQMWMELDLDQKQQFQQVLFPEGLRFDSERFGTAVTCLAFKQLAEDGQPESGMASPSIPSWNQILSFLQQMAQLREIPGSAA